MPLRNAEACCSLVWPYSSFKYSVKLFQVSSVASPNRNSLIFGFRLTSNLGSRKKNLSFGVVMEALAKAPSIRFNQTSTLALSKVGSSGLRDGHEVAGRCIAARAASAAAAAASRTAVAVAAEAAAAVAAATSSLSYFFLQNYCSYEFETW